MASTILSLIFILHLFRYSFCIILTSLYPGLAIVRPQLDIGRTDDRDFSMSSSRLGHRGRENRNRPSEICSKNSRPISSLRSKWTRRIYLELPKLQSRELLLLCNETQYSCDNPRYSNSILVSQVTGVMGCHRKTTASMSVKHFSCDKSIIPSVSSPYDFVLNF